ncbi:MAG TPA: YXWGXW repeat-containing protein [Bryobacteraceae bacterium]|nr:YXWGXW repeat-containing protein [Bryobacteraceae bacterium]
MKTKLLAMMLLAGGAVFAQPRFSVGIGFDQAPPGYASNIPPCPGPGYTWVDGYWSQNYGQPAWIAGYWNAPVFTTGFGFAPSFDDHFRGGFERDRGFDGDRNFNGPARNFTQGPARGFNQGQARGQQGGRSNGHDGRGNSSGFRGH